MLTNEIYISPTHEIQVGLINKTNSQKTYNSQKYDEPTHEIHVDINTEPTEAKLTVSRLTVGKSTVARPSGTHVGHIFDSSIGLTNDISTD